LPARTIELPDDGLLDPCHLFAQPIDGCWLEIGFGSGENLIGQAIRHPTIGMIGCEPYLDGVACLLAAAAAHQLENLRIFPGDGRQLIGCLPDATIGRVFLLFPDPWPKRRHHRRRLVSPPTVRQLGRILVDEGELWFVTDHADYVRWTLEQVLESSWFEWPAQRPTDWRLPPPGWIGTRYERKALVSGADICYLVFRRKRRKTDAHTA
jgi:tRNA (guanine-N7-)-methyltransferase